MNIGNRYLAFPYNLLQPTAALRWRKALLDVVQRWKFAYGRFAPAQILALAIRDAGPHTATNQQEDAGGRCDR